MLCITETCTTKAYCKQMCQKHYRRWKKHGSPHTIGQSGQPKTPFAERFWRHIDILGPDECWPWKGYIAHNGYAIVHLDDFRKTMTAHRAAYLLTHGSIPEALVMDHLCRNRSCMNPKHLEAVTQRENLIRGDTLPGRNSRKTHCLRGHPFDQSNTWKTKEGHRHCRECARIRSRTYKSDTLLT
jgi:hypothetical protein